MKTPTGRDALTWALTASALAIVLSPMVTVLSGTVYLSALVLLPITVVIWLLTRISRSDLGINLGKPGHYVMALLYPAAVIGVIVLLISVFGGIHTEEFRASRVIMVVTVNSLAGILVGLLTEEGFFRGLLWGLFRARGYSEPRILVFTSVVFMFWHIPVVFLEFGPGFPQTAIPIYLANVLLLGLNWGLLRAASKSIVVASVSHAVWNALVYKFFGFGSESGVLAGISFQIFGPERGILGLVLNLAFLLILWKWHKHGA